MKRKTIKLITVLFVVSLLVSLPLQAYANSELQELREMILNLESGPGKTVRGYNSKSGWVERTVYPRPEFTEDPIYQRAIDLGEPALEVLEPLLTHENDRMVLTAARCISIIGGERAREILMKASDRDDKFKPYLIVSLASTASREDVSLLLRTVEDKAGEAQNVRSAKYDAFTSLSLIRTEEALKALEKLTRSEDLSISLAAKQAIARNEVWKGMPSRKKEDIKSVLMNEMFAITGNEDDVPLIQKIIEDQMDALQMDRSREQEDMRSAIKDAITAAKNTQYFESCGEDKDGKIKDAQRIWSYENGIWSDRRIKKNWGEKVPRVCFRTYTSQDGTRAIVSFSEYYGPLNAMGHWAVLKKVDSEWKLVFTGVSWIS